jgi:glycosyltransferase involved in cell wall biosynthesis
MNKEVCAFVFNPFTNDARVLRECSALAEVGYNVDLICINNHEGTILPKKERREEGFNVIRVDSKLPSILNIFIRICSAIMSIIKKNLVTKLLSIVLFIYLLFLAPITTIIVGILVFILGNSTFEKVLRRGYNILQMIYYGLKKKYDVFHANDLNTLPQAIICGKLFRKSKVIYDSHEVQTSRSGYDSPIFGKIENFLIKYIDIMIHENDTRAIYTKELYNIPLPKVIHNYPFVSRPEESKSVNLHQLVGIPEDEPILLYQGGIQKGRGLELIVQATPLFKRGYVVFIGDGNIKTKLENLVEEMNLGDRVRFVSKVPVEDLLNYTNFNHYSASSNKLFEYMMSGVPAVACSFPEIKKVIDVEKTGLCVDSHDIESIANGVNYLLDHPKERDEMSKNCLNARHKYNWENEKQIFLSIYDQVLAGEKSLAAS